LIGSDSLSLPKEFFAFLKQKIENVPFPYIIEMTTGCKVQPLSSRDDLVVKEIYNAAKEVLEWSRSRNFNGIERREISNELEAQLRGKLGGEIPEGKTAGYPNILIRRKEVNYYIEVKVAGEEQLKSSFRSFYYEPVELAKVTKDACHVMVGYIHKNKKILGFKIVDLSKINVSLKNEFNTNNKELYKKDAIVREYSSQPSLM
jgi:hypothetical protein